MCSDGALSYRTSSKRCVYGTRVVGCAASNASNMRAAVSACFGSVDSASPVDTNADSKELSAYRLVSRRHSDSIKYTSVEYLS